MTKEKSKTTQVYVAVYGTLKKNERLHSYLKDNKAKYIQNIKIKNSKLFKPEQLFYPILVQNDKYDTKVKAELYEITEELLEKLDKIEFPAGYHRTEQLTTVKHKEIPVNYYFMHELKKEAMEAVLGKEFKEIDNFTNKDE